MLIPSPYMTITIQVHTLHIKYMLPSWLSLPLRNPSPLHVRLSCVSGQPITKQASVHTSIFLQSLIVPLSIFQWSCVSKNILMTLENPIVSIRILYLGLNIIGIFVYYGFWSFRNVQSFYSENESFHIWIYVLNVRIFKIWDGVLNTNNKSWGYVV